MPKRARTSRNIALEDLEKELGLDGGLGGAQPAGGGGGAAAPAAAAPALPAAAAAASADAGGEEFDMGEFEEYLAGLSTTNS